MLSPVSFLRRRSTWLIGIPVLVLLVAVVGPFVYINFIQDDPPERLTLDPSSTSTTSATAEEEPAGRDGVEGQWAVAGDSVVGYRVKEILFGQDTTAVGRTSEVTGAMTIEGTIVQAAEFSVALASVTSDRDNRDNQFRGRIMDVAQFPTATFSLTEPIDLGELPTDGEQATYSATGELTLRGVTRPVTFDLTARRSGETIEVNGTIPLVLSDYGIPNPSFGPAEVGDEGELEFLLAFA